MMIPYSFLRFFSLSAVVLLHLARTLGFAMVHMHAWTQKRFTALRPPDVRLFIHSLRYSTLAREIWNFKFRCRPCFFPGSEALLQHDLASGVCSCVWQPMEFVAQAHAHAPGTCSLCLGPASVVLFWKKRYSTLGARQIDGA